MNNHYLRRPDFAAVIKQIRPTFGGSRLHLAGVVSISLANCHTAKMYGTNGGTPIPAVSPNKNNPIFNYTSLENAMNNIYDHLIVFTGINFPRPANFLNEFEWHDGTTWAPLGAKLTW